MSSFDAVGVGGGECFLKSVLRKLNKNWFCGLACVLETSREKFLGSFTKFVSFSILYQ